jgi:hypothetical protein
MEKDAWDVVGMRESLDGRVGVRGRRWGGGWVGDGGREGVVVRRGMGVIFLFTAGNAFYSASILSLFVH